MKVVLLAGGVPEGRRYARDAGLAPADVVVVGHHFGVLGLPLGDDDLVVEFPSFKARKDAPLIVDHLLRSINRSGSKPLWVKPGAK